MSDSNYAACLCGKKRLKLNETNWKRHLTFCKVAKLKKNNTVVDVHNFFTKKRKINNEDVPEKDNCDQIDKCQFNNSTTIIDAVHSDSIHLASVTSDLSRSGNDFKSKQPVGTNHVDLSNDPDKYKMLVDLSPTIVDFLIKKGPMQPTVDDLPTRVFPKDKFGRSFQTSWYWKSLPGNVNVRRDWLSYSVSSDKMFCHHCLLFGRNINKAWSVDGVASWPRALQSMQIHECSEAHIEASLKLKLKKISLPILPLLEEKHRRDKAINKEIVLDLIDITFFLAKNCIAFRGHKESLKEELGNRGNFLDLVHLMSKRSPCLASYITKLQLSTKKQNVSLISNIRQNQLIGSLASAIRTSIQEELKTARFFSISIDSTFDLSRKEQISFVVRYVNSTVGTVSERLIALRESSVTTGFQLFNIFEKLCVDLSIDWEQYLVGQSYDGAQNMRGEFQGLKTYVQQKCPSATFIWCHAHRLNLIVAKSVGCNINAIDLFGNLESVYNFICGSKKRVAIYETKQDCYCSKRTRRLKRVATTRWMSHGYALDSILETFEAVIETLDDVRNNEGCNDQSTGHIAGCLIEYLLSRRFLLIAFCFKYIFEILGPVNILLQSKDLDLLSAMNSIHNAQLDIQNLRDGNIFNKILIDVNNFINKFSQFEFSDKLNQRIRPFDEYFDNSSIGIYKDLSLFSKKRLDEVKKNPASLPKDAFSMFCKVYGKYVDQDYLIEKEGEEEFSSESESDNEIEMEPRKVINVGSMKALYQIFHAGNLGSVFPTLNNALQIALTLPVSSASTERAFSKLKIIKTRLRTTMNNTRLEDLMLITCEQDMYKNSNKVLEIFASNSTELCKMII
ncbi:zinc finger MYM-type protein 1-like [Melanaphis sacchari]|uniref:zinc finger MYM-type protein 1-like n=1 Tax=Melanaphis sacchari TaxID=742174 RepID=UPI000DC132F2|nr:zinc finger MYM-type protein 1-like [Melanaphis sacchari]